MQHYVLIPVEIKINFIEGKFNDGLADSSTMPCLRI